MQRHLLTVNLSPMKKRDTNIVGLCKGYLFPLNVVETVGWDIL